MDQIPLPSLPQLLNVARDTAVSAGQLAREKWYAPRDVQSKGFRDLVTDVDVAAQKMIVTGILQAFPDHGFLPEEEDDSLPQAGPIIWIIDPIDGTTNYSRQQPNFAISVAATRPIFDAQQNITAYEPLAGVVYDPMRHELFSAMKGEGARLEDGSGHRHTLKVSTVDNLQNAVLCLSLGSSELRRQQAQKWLHAFNEDIFTVRSIGSATLSLVWVAAGRFDIYFNQNIKAWDVAAGALILQEAGGEFSNLAGDGFAWLSPQAECVATNGRIHTTTLQILNDHKI